VNDPVALPAPPHAVPRRHRAVAALGRALQPERADPGTLAALRRADPASPPPAFYRVTVDVLDEHLPEAGPLRDALEIRWAVVVSAMANAQGLLARVPLGEALARAGVAEMRVLRLLEAQDTQLADLVRHVVHQLVQKGQPFDPDDLADLVLTGGTDRAQEPRRRIARSYYRHADT
jgi:CRISPR type I-E-associated protein CasB/Cse2